MSAEGRQWKLGSVRTAKGALLAVAHLTDAAALERTHTETHALSMLGTAGGAGPAWAIEFAGPRNRGRTLGVKALRAGLEECGLETREAREAMLDVLDVREAVERNGAGYAATVLASAGGHAREHLGAAYGAARTLVEAWDESKGMSEESTEIEGAVATTTEGGRTHWSGTVWMRAPGPDPEVRVHAQAFLADTIAAVRASIPHIEPLCPDNDAVIEARDPRGTEHRALWAWAYRTEDTKTGALLQTEDAVYHAVQRMRMAPTVDVLGRTH